MTQTCPSPASRRPSLTLALLAALIGSTALPALAQDGERPAPRPTEAQSQVPAGGPTTDGPAPAVAADTPAVVQDAPPMQGLAGPYLAARMATVENDFRAAARYFVQAAAHDPDDIYLQDSALVALASAGEVDKASELAADLFRQDRPTELAGLLERARLVRAEDWDGVVTLIDTTRNADLPLNEDLMDGTIRAWALLGAGRATEAVAAFEAMAATEDLTPIVNYHLALARALAGDYETADRLIVQSEAGGHLMGLIARVQILSQLDRRDEAMALLDSVEGLEAEPQLVALRQRLEQDQPVPFDVVAGPGDGIAHLLLSFASALASSPDPEPLALIHARLAAWIAPRNPEARLMAAQLLQDRQQFDLAEAEFEAVRRMGQMRPQAELSRIDALSRAERPDEAEKAALALTAAYPGLPQSWIALGDVMRSQEKYSEAVPSYDTALDLLAEAPPEIRWFPLYARGIALERAGQFDRAEADLLAALEIRPDHASLLNYLGYSWIDRNQNLERALGMIKRAAELSPGDGYILDSLAWAYFRLGRFDDAVAPMEQAIATMASDPLVNDHLGDIYWKVGRQREAQIQWQRALSLEPGESGDVDPDRIRAKLDRGLDAVMEDEDTPVATHPNQAPKTEADATE
ncbi:tetratricopeptide repeat protein [Paracoccus nototheniae]|uniref:Tetratricopeptide repeat protein n=1 Tax=Paracoccus nototheniae TaxID=2489002 RepID=A0ABW4DVX9_9RHOB|nr:tetratricopeptide repeat protein [Paracoccus nototheniae]